jgi:ankyrin repeat protein
MESPLKGALTLASALGDIPAIEALVAQGVRVDDESAFFRPAIRVAGEHGNIDAVKVLLKHSERSPYHIYGAIYGGHRDIMQLFLDAYYTKGSSDPYGFKHYDTSREIKWMIDYAASSDQPALIDILIEYLPPKPRWEVVTKGCALYSAVQHSAISTISSLLEAGVNITRLNEGFGTALDMASEKGDLKIVKLLLEHGFYDSEGAYGDAMHIAAVKGHTDIVQLFLDDYGVDVNCPFGNPLMLNNDDFWEGLSQRATTNAAWRGDFHMFCFLVRKGARVDVNGTVERRGKREWTTVDLGPLQRQWLEQIREWDAQSSIAE